LISAGKKKKRGIAVALLALVLVSAAYYFVLVAQTNYQLDSPLIPAQMKERTVHALLVRGAVLGLLSCGGVVLFFYKRCYLLITIAIIALMGDALI